MRHGKPQKLTRQLIHLVNSCPNAIQHCRWCHLLLLTFAITTTPSHIVGHRGWRWAIMARWCVIDWLIGWCTVACTSCINRDFLVLHRISNGNMGNIIALTATSDTFFIMLSCTRIHCITSISSLVTGRADDDVDSRCLGLVIGKQLMKVLLIRMAMLVPCSLLIYYYEY